MSKNNKTSTIKPFYIGEGGVRRSEEINSAESERNTKKYYCTALHYWRGWGGVGPKFQLALLFFPGSHPCFVSSLSFLFLIAKYHQCGLIFPYFFHFLPPWRSCLPSSLFPLPLYFPPLFPRVFSPLPNPTPNISKEESVGRH